MDTNPAVARTESRISSGVLALLVFSVFINYVDRSNLSVAAPILKDELGLSASQLGILLSAFFWTYAGLQIPSGWLVDHVDVKWVFAGGFFLWSVATAVTGLLHSFAMLLVVRVALGIGESVAYPSYSKIMANHAAERHRGFANSMIAMGLALGPSFGMLFGGTLMARFGWRPFFVVLGLVSLLWLVPWLSWMPPTNTHTDGGGRKGPGLAEIARQRSLWGTSAALFCGNYCLYFLLTWLPYYLVRERGFSLNGMAKVGGGVFLAAAISASVCGRLSDRWIVAGNSATLVRKTFMVVSLLGIGVFLGASVVSPRAPSVALLIVAALFFGLGSSNIWAITQTLAGPQAVGRWAGVQLFVGNLAGAVAPAVTGFLVQRTGHFTWAFFIVSGLTWIGALIWIFGVGPVEPVVWGKRQNDISEIMFR